jgi:hypothetical protein
MRGAVVQDQVKTANVPTPDAPEEHPQKPLELGKALPLKAPRQGLSSVHQQATERLHCALTLIAIRHVQRPTGSRRRRGPAGPPGLDRRLIIRADDEVALPGKPLGNRDGPCEEACVGGTLPAMVLPRLDAVGLEQALDSAA